MIIGLATSTRFPAPEFDNYDLPTMGLESYVGDTTALRIGLLVLFLILSGLCFHRFRSRKAILLVSFSGLVIFGFLFRACPCPVGLFQNIADSAVNGTPISIAYLLLFAVPLACALIWGRLFCSGACPLGALQELLNLKSFRIPGPIDRVLRMIPVLVLIICSVVAASGALYPLCYLDPYLSIFLLSFTSPFVILTIVFLLLGLFISRPFCRFICPYGVLLRFFAIFSVKPPKITNATCIDCKLCEQGCPIGAIISPEDKTTSDNYINGRRRLSLLIVCLPVVLLVGGVVGHISAPMLAYLHPDVSLLYDLQEHHETLSTKAFDLSGSSISRLEVQALRANSIFSIGMSLGGILFAACFMAEIISFTRRRVNDKQYTIDSGLCVCCGRCYQACPLEKHYVQKVAEHEA